MCLVKAGSDSPSRSRAVVLRTSYLDTGLQFRRTGRGNVDLIENASIGNLNCSAMRDAAPPRAHTAQGAVGASARNRDHWERCPIQ